MADIDTKVQAAAGQFTPLVDTGLERGLEALRMPSTSYEQPQNLAFLGITDKTLHSFTTNPVNGFTMVAELAADHVPGDKIDMDRGSGRPMGFKPTNAPQADVDEPARVNVGGKLLFGPAAQAALDLYN